MDSKSEAPIIVPNRQPSNSQRVKNTTFSESFFKESDPIHAADKLSIVKRDSGPIQPPEKAKSKSAAPPG
ncbi:hypothetical protein I350_04249 [Cryptococcus amylolentus CBS 6273]|uniref:Uncharacterized protein n=1 Tax=Cryptococcus amylolentus CBS 6273 TaxID=1296118 RepID=A0A1E3K1G5_9TREE|nr:hypothetical protein I350_04249 [Cryptococcus amylolentus CBS 6273]